MRLALANTHGARAAGLVDRDAETWAPLTDWGNLGESGLVELIAQEADGSYDISRGARGSPVPLSEIELLAPIPRPLRNIMCVGKNYVPHAVEFAESEFDRSGKNGDAIPDIPIFFTKASTAVIGPGELIRLHREVTRSLDYEAEIGVVIGIGGTNISRSDAGEHIWGYTIINDVTARDIQRDHVQWFRGKSLDTFCPMGPWLVSADEIDVSDMTLSCWVNGELRQRADGRDLIFDVPELIEFLSAGMTLIPGDVIATGTPAGVGMALDPPCFLGSGDEVAISISGLGMLENRVS